MIQGMIEIQQVFQYLQIIKMMNRKLEMKFHILKEFILLTLQL